MSDNTVQEYCQQEPMEIPRVPGQKIYKLLVSFKIYNGQDMTEPLASMKVIMNLIEATSFFGVG